MNKNIETLCFFGLGLKINTHNPAAPQVILKVCSNVFLAGSFMGADSLVIGLRSGV